MKRPNLIVSILHLLGIVTLRFRIIPRVFATWLMAVNLACVFFLGHIEGIVALAAAGTAVIGMAIMYQRIQFTRLLGIFHVLWVPMILWLVSRWDTIAQDQALATWVGLMIATNIVSLIVDTVDVSRYMRGEKKPSYAW